LFPLDTAVSLKPQLAIFSAGGDISMEWAPKFAAVGTTVIDNSSAWRMDPTKQLIVPEINGYLLKKEDKIISNPNCSTIQLVMVLAPLHKKFGVKRVSCFNLSIYYWNWRESGSTIRK
jgi:aspartate-semialdehyde dehydrogenase